MALDYQCTFNLKDCIETLGLSEHGRVQKVVAEAVLRLSEPYVPFDEGALLASGRVVDNSVVEWGGNESGAYARYMWNGIVYEDPERHCAGFPTENGWRSRKDVQKVPTARSLEYHGGSLRGSHWVPRMLQDGGRKQIEDAARRAVRR